MLAADVRTVSVVRHGFTFFACYVLAVVVIGLLFSIPSVEDALHQVIGRRAWLFMMLRNPVPYLGTAGILWYGADRERRRVLLRLFSERRGSLLWTSLIASFASIVLVRLGLWPWEFNRPGAQLGELIAVFVRSGLWLPIVLHVVAAVILGPVCEELAFRFGLLQWLLARGLTSFTSVSISSVLFGLVHWGAINVVEPWALRRMFFATVLGYVGGCLAIRDNGAVVRAIAVHAARNGMEALFLVVSIVAHVRTHR